MASAAYLCSSFLIHASVCLSFIFSATCAVGSKETDRLSLFEFKAKITDDPFGVMSSWNDTTNFCNWHGVTCGQRHQRVTVLDLSSSKLAGSVSPHIGNLSFLSTLLLQKNSFHYEIPPEIGRLRRLRTIILANNSFTGEIPANISGCSNVTSLNFMFNKLVGEIPRELASFSQLESFVVAGNNLTGRIPSFFANFSFLKELDATQNNLVGSIPEALGRLTNLQRVGLGSNSLSGTVPPSFYNISSLTYILLAENQFQGTLPTDLGDTLPDLEILNIGFNQFTGVIPMSISNATNLFLFAAIKNNLTGKVPNMEKLKKLQTLGFSFNHLGTREADDLSFVSSLANATSLRLLALNSNNFQGLLPESISNLSTTLEILAFSDNQFFGTIPSGVLELEKLQGFFLHDNKLTGVIPSGIGMLKKLNYIYIEGNEFSGNIPSSIGNLSLLAELRLDDNNFQGHIPSSIGKCHNLVGLNLSCNNLSGSIPIEVVGLSSLSVYFDLSNNHLTGSLPIEVGKLINLAELKISHNMMSGEIPSSLGSCIKLETLMMQENFFQGTIPSSLSSLRGIAVLDLSNNNLTGQIPLFLEDFKSLKELNLSFNDFEGVVPEKGVFNNASSASVIGNNMLCGGIADLGLPVCIIKSNKRRFTLTVKLIIIISGFLSVISVSCSLYFLLVWRKKVPRASTSNVLGSLQTSYQSLLNATDGFSSANLIGMGSFGSVYKGILDNGGTIIAVKVLKLLHQGASKSFIAECKALSNIRHRNLVKILSVCSGVDYHGNDFKAIVYKFMANGSLEEWLHPSHPRDEAHEAPKVLNLIQRIDVATDVACALDYLHHQCETPIVHCDLKPSNVLLDHDMTAHVGDFGLARFLIESNKETSQRSSIGVKGTVGYAAPEYGMGSKVSTSGDVYSYGILLLELFTGKRPTDNMFKDGLNLHKFAGYPSPERVAEILDPFLVKEIFHSGMLRGHEVEECLIYIIDIGVACSAEFPQGRMNMSHVAAKLQSIRDRLH